MGARRRMCDPIGVGAVLCGCAVRPHQTERGWDIWAAVVVPLMYGGVPAAWSGLAGLFIIGGVLGRWEWLLGIWNLAALLSAAPMVLGSLPALLGTLFAIGG